MEKQCGGVTTTIGVIGNKWTIPILWALCSEPKGFNQLEREVQGVSPRILSERLKEMAANNLVEKTVFPTTPPTVQYALTAKGRSLKPIIAQLDEWGNS